MPESSALYFQGTTQLNGGMGLVFHARGLINSRVIQHNRDWVWPFWVERQFDPRDPAFIPRAFHPGSH